MNQQKPMNITPEYTPDPRGLVSKYIVLRRNDDGTPGKIVEGPTFTLRPFDPHARVAMVAYAASVAKENEHLAADLIGLVKQHGCTDAEIEFILRTLDYFQSVKNLLFEMIEVKK